MPIPTTAKFSNISSVSRGMNTFLPSRGIARPNLMVGHTIFYNTLY